MKRLIGYIMRVSRQQSTRKQLASLSDESLKDLGISRTDAKREADKHFWQ